MSPRRLLLRTGVLLYLALLLALPLATLLVRTFTHGPGPVLAALTSPDALSALGLSLLITAVAVPLNALFGLGLALAVAHHRMPWPRLAAALANLPLALSPVVAGLGLFLLYGRTGLFGGLLAVHGVQVLFAPPGMILATVFVTLPFVLRAVLPVLEGRGRDEEEAAATLGAPALAIFWRVTLPRIRQALAYGAVLTAAFAMGEYGAVSIVSGQVLGVTETLTIHAAIAYSAFDLPGTFATSLLLLLASTLLLIAMRALRPEEVAHVD